jgi:hypothetical protein
MPIYRCTVYFISIKFIYLLIFFITVPVARTSSENQLVPVQVANNIVQISTSGIGKCAWPAFGLF